MNPMEADMEKWNIVYEGKIPKEDYAAYLNNSDEYGLSVKLVGLSTTVDIFFGAGASVRMLEEFMIPYRIVKSALKNRKIRGFSNVIYEIIDGDFGNFVKEALLELYEEQNHKHYIIVTMNNIVEVVTGWDPEISVHKNIHDCEASMMD